MSLASLTIDLNLGLAKFEADSGKAAQIIVRDASTMSRGAAAFEAALKRQADQAAKTSVEMQTIKAAALGLGDNTLDLIQKLSGAGAAFASIGVSGKGAFAGVAAAADSLAGKTNALLSTMVAKIRDVNAQAEALRSSAIARNQGGSLSDSGLKEELASIQARKAGARELLDVEYAQESQALKVAAAEAEAATVRAAAAQKLIDVNNGLTATFRAQLLALRELRDAGNLSPAQFKQAGAELVARQPAVQQRNAAQSTQSAQDVRDQQAALDVANQRALAIQKLIDLSQKFNYRQDAAEIDRLRATVEAENAAEEKAAAESIASAEERRIAAQRIIDVQNGLTASYRTQLQALRELRDAGNLTPAQFKTAATDLVNRQPGVAARNQQQAAQEQAARAAAQSALALAQTSSATATAAAQTQVYTAFLIAQAAANERAAQAEQHQADVTKAVNDATQRSTDAQREAYAVKTQYIAKVTEEADALFRTRDAQRELDAVRAGVSQQQAQQLAKLSGDRDFIASIYTQIEAQQKFADQFGKTATEILKQDAAERGLTNTTASAIARFDTLATANKKATDSAAAVASNNAFTASVERQANAIGKLPSQLLAEEAALRGLTDQLAPAIAKLTDFEAKTGQAGKAAFGTKNQLLTLHYTLSDVVASLASGISPFTILAQQGGQVYDAFGQNFTSLFKTVASLFTPVRIAIGGVTAAVGLLVYAFHEGAAQSKEFKDSIVLTGGFAGVTEGQFNALAKGIAASGQIAISSAREFGQALISTGQVGPQVLGAATEAAARYGAASGKNAKDVAQDFASMTADVTAWATSHNKQLNFLSASQLLQIKTLKDTGQEIQAEGIIYEALNARLRQLEPNLGTLDKAIRAVTSTWHGFWDAAFDIGRTETIDDKIKKLEAQLAARNKPVFGVPDENAEVSAQVQRGSGTDDDVRGQLATLRESKRLAERAAAATAERADITQQAQASRAIVEQYEKQGKGADLLKQKLIELRAAFALNDKAGTPFSATQQAAAIKGLEDSFKDTKGIGEADAQRKARLDQDLKNLQDNFAHEQDAFNFQQQFLSAQYANSEISLKDYYDAKDGIISAGVAAELATLKSEEARIKQELAQGAFKDPHERIQLQTQLNELVAKSAKVAVDAGHAASLARLQEAEATRQLGDRVQEYRAQLAQSEGDETKAAAIRANVAIQNAKLFANTANGAITPDDLARQARATQAANELADIQRRTAIVNADASRAEELEALRAVQRGDSLLKQEQDVYAIRSKQLVQLKAFADQTQALADSETARAAGEQRAADPKILADAANAALNYAKALDSVDPALNRLRDSVKSVADSIADDIGGAINEFKGFPALFESISKTLLQAGTKFFVTDPLKAGLEGIFKQATEGSSPLAGFLKGAAGVGGASGGGTAAASLTSQTTALATSTATIDAFNAALGQATVSLGGSTATSATSAGSDTGLFASIGKFLGFGGGGAAAGGSAAGTVASDDALALFFHSGGIVGAGGRAGMVPASVFRGAQVLHGGGLAGLKADEVPAILKKREEVLTQNNPRHRDNWSGSSGTTIQQTNHFTVEPTTSRNSQGQILAAVGMATQRAVRRNGG